MFCALSVRIPTNSLTPREKNESIEQIREEKRVQNGHTYGSHELLPVKSLCSKCRYCEVPLTFRASKTRYPLCQVFVG